MVTGFDYYLKEKGFELVTGKLCDLSTYNNCWRVWKGMGHYISIGLYADPTRIGVESTNGTMDLPIPNENQYEDYLKRLT